MSVVVVRPQPPARVVVRRPGPPGPKGDPGPGIQSNVGRITVATDPPPDPDPNDLWVQIP